MSCRTSCCYTPAEEWAKKLALDGFLRQGSPVTTIKEIQAEMLEHVLGFVDDGDCTPSNDTIARFLRGEIWKLTNNK